MYRGDSYPLIFTIKDSATDDPISLSGCALVMTVASSKNPIDDGSELFEVNGVIDADPTTGIVSFTPTTSNTNLAPGKYYYDIQLTDSLSNIRTIIKSELKIIQDITK